jgi:glycerol-3-phosphate cytidylyltransferase
MGYNMRRVLTYGTFDTLHFGHIRLLQRARALGDYLIVGLSTEEFNSKKQKQSLHSWEERKFLLESLRCVDLVIAENDWEQKRSDVNLYRVDVFTMGSDWEGKFDFLSELCEVVYLPRTPNISSTQIRQFIGEAC